MHSKLLQAFVPYLLFILFSGFSQVFAETAGPAGYKEAVARLTHISPNNVDSTVEWFARHYDDENLAPLLAAVWRVDKKNFPMFNWAVLKPADVHLRFVTLYALQLRAKDPDQLALEGVKAFVVAHRQSPDPRVRIRAITFTVISDSCDLNYFRTVALQGDSLFSALAVNSIVEILGRDSRKVLVEIQSKTNLKGLKDSIKWQLDNLEKRNYPDARFYKVYDKCSP